MAFTSTNLDARVVPYVHQSFPKYVTHATEPARVVPDEAAWVALGVGWGHPSDTPADPTPRHVGTVTHPPVARRRGRPRKDGT